MRGVALAAVALAVFALNWAALHDIIKGEPDVVLEWAMVAASALIMLLVAPRALVRAIRA